MLAPYIYYAFGRIGLRKAILLRRGGAGRDRIIDGAARPGLDR